jgi:hypothetical protein
MKHKEEKNMKKKTMHLEMADAKDKMKNMMKKKCSKKK